MDILNAVQNKSKSELQFHPLSVCGSGTKSIYSVSIQNGYWVIYSYKEKKQYIRKVD